RRARRARRPRDRAARRLDAAQPRALARGVHAGHPIRQARQARHEQRQRRGQRVRRPRDASVRPPGAAGPTLSDDADPAAGRALPGLQLRGIPVLERRRRCLNGCRGNGGRGGRGRARHMTRGWRQKGIALGLVLASSVLALLLGEFAGRLAVHPGDFLTARRAEHPVLGHRIEPNTTGHDALGFRNPAVPERAEVVAIGDSVTYGYAAARDDSWPHQTGVLLRQPVYNMGLGGYGPLEYVYLAEHEAKKLRPSLLLVGFNFGNDLVDAYTSAYQNSYWREWRDTGATHRGES